MELGLKSKHFEFELKAPVTKKPTGVHIELYAPDDPKVMDCQRRILDGTLKRSQSKEDRTYQDAKDESDEMIFSRIASWRWEEDKDRGVTQPKLNGNPAPELNLQNVKTLFGFVDGHYRKQIDDKAADIANFFGA
jgi:hypothetical protein